MTVCDVAGRRIARLFDADQSPGVHDVQWNATGLASGVYFVRIEALGEARVAKLVLLKWKPTKIQADSKVQSDPRVDEILCWELVFPIGSFGAELSTVEDDRTLICTQCSM